MINKCNNNLQYLARKSHTVALNGQCCTAQGGGTSMPKKLLTVKESAEQLGLSARTVWAWVYARKLGVVRLGRAVRIPQSAVDELIEAGSIPAKVR
jgi:excisionase family DNA binding protein